MLCFRDITTFTVYVTGCDFGKSCIVHFHSHISSPLDQ